ncbi:hypothetical protein D918_08030 [Trichuris suis]|uniref:Uncharacterized protein n=1 Tax=Trichuris suis TaxID=68888 RepID=A0A085LNA4_9BILA|nr:hypothetical protein M513_12679 [Trichuris suis]KHJ41978.1 hypothetical protein D918_08030 [Trichuris suis]
MGQDDSSRALAEPQLGVGSMVREVLHLLGISSLSLAALLRIMFRSWFGLRWISTAAVILRSEAGKSRSLIRALGNTLSFPVGNVFVHFEEIPKPSVSYAPLDGSSGSDLWENADTCESETVDSGSDNGVSESSVATCPSLEAERIAKLEAEVQALKELLIDYKKGVLEKCRTVDSSSPSQPASTKVALNGPTERKPLSNDDKVKQSIPEAPPLPTFLKPSRASVPLFAVAKKRSNEQPANGVLSKSESCNNVVATPYSSDLLKELPNVRLRPVQKSPGGTPLVRRKHTPDTELANLFELMLNRKFANACTDTEEDEDDWDSQVSTDARWPSS